MDPNQIQDVLRHAATDVRTALEGFTGKGLSGQKPGQYALDLVADAAACDVLLRAGFRVFSEESGMQGSGELVAVVDPVDGSTNADRGIPFFCVSICVLDERGPLVGLVENLPVGTRYEGVRSLGAWRDGETISTSGATSIRGAMIGVNGTLPTRPGWAQTRTMGAAALESCLVAEGALDAFVQGPGVSIHPWDYLAGMLIAQEAGASVRSMDGDELVVLEPVSRRPLLAATAALADELVELLG